jgi:hypothetical protein
MSWRHKNEVMFKVQVFFYKEQIGKSWGDNTSVLQLGLLPMALFCIKFTWAIKTTQPLPVAPPNGTARFKKYKQFFEYQHLLLLRDIWWSKL